MTAVREYNDKILQFLPSSFSTIITDIIRIRECLEKYCKSFFKGEQDPYLETAVHYDMKIKDMKSAIDMHLDNIQIMAKGYRDDVRNYFPPSGCILLSSYDFDIHVIALNLLLSREIKCHKF